METLSPYKMIRIGYQDQKSIQYAFESLKELRKDYPYFPAWFYTKVTQGIADGSRQLWFAVTIEDIVAGILILKKSPIEKKVCTLYVREPFRRKGVGTLMMYNAFSQLETSTPLATVSSNQLSKYEALLRHFNFHLHKEYKDYYRYGSVEYSFNGELNTSICDHVANW